MWPNSDRCRPIWAKLARYGPNSVTVWPRLADLSRLVAGNRPKALPGVSFEICLNVFGVSFPHPCGGEESGEHFGSMFARSPARGAGALLQHVVYMFRMGGAKWGWCVFFFCGGTTLIDGSCCRLLRAKTQCPHEKQRVPLQSLIVLLTRSSQAHGLLIWDSLEGVGVVFAKQ